MSHSGMQAVAVYGLQVPPDGIMVESNPGVPASFRVTMAAIDPTEEPFGDNAVPPRVTLKIIRNVYDAFDSDEEYSDDDEFDEDDVEAIKRRLGITDEDLEIDDLEDDDEELVNGGPSDPEKLKKAKLESVLRTLDDEDDDVDMDITNGINGSVNKGKARLIDDDSEVSDDNEVTEFVVCTLDPNQHYQQALDITIGEGEEVYFRAIGTHSIYLTGNFIVPADEITADDDDESDEDYSDDELMGLGGFPDGYGDDIDISDSEEDELDDLADPRIAEVDSEEEAPKLVKTKKSKNKRAAEDSDDEDKADMGDTIKKILMPDAEPKLSKRQAKKLKNNAGDAVEGASTEKAKVKNSEVKKDDKKSKKDEKKGKKEEQSPTNGKKVQFAEKLEQGPTGNNSGKTGPRVVSGVTVDDKKSGSGPGAKKGDKVGMRYIGKLSKKDGKIFDSNTKGQPFKFKLGSGEVIKGWDIGVQGMCVGGERRITIPAHLAYGSKGMPGIPANSELVFDLKLISIN